MSKARVKNQTITVVNSVYSDELEVSQLRLVSAAAERPVASTPRAKLEAPGTTGKTNFFCCKKPPGEGLGTRKRILVEPGTFCVYGSPTPADTGPQPFLQQEQVGSLPLSQGFSFVLGCYHRLSAAASNQEDLTCCSRFLELQCTKGSRCAFLAFPLAPEMSGQRSCSRAGVRGCGTSVNTERARFYKDSLPCSQAFTRRLLAAEKPDNRVQCCLYFIAPSGHGLKSLDIEFMKRLHEKVNIIPLIAKADTLTPEECQQFKKQIMKEIQEHKIKIYEFPETDDEEENKLVKKIKDRLPLAVVGSNTIIEVNGKRVRGRQYPWGVAEVENGEHCDFTILRNMLIRTHMQDLKDVTNNVHYENYRSRKLAAVTYNGVDNNKNKGQLTKSPLVQMEEERREHVAKMKKMEMEMEQVFEMKVKEKVQKLKDSEAELQRRHEQMKMNLEAQHKELEEKRRQFEEEKANWEAQQRILEQQNSSRTLEKNKKKGKIF
eukprot:XP_008770563.1 PREDICTED: septin-7-like [Rattus norvegicus]